MKHTLILLLSTMITINMSFCQYEDARNQISVNLNTLQVQDLFKLKSRTSYGELYSNELKDDYDSDRLSFKPSYELPYALTVIFSKSVTPQKRNTFALSFLNLKDSWSTFETVKYHKTAFDTLTINNGKQIYVDSVTTSFVNAWSSYSAFTLEYGFKYLHEISSHSLLTINPRLRTGLLLTDVTLFEVTESHFQYRHLNPANDHYPADGHNNRITTTVNDKRMDISIGVVLPLQIETKISNRLNSEIGITLNIAYRTTSHLAKLIGRGGVSGGVIYSL